MLAVASMTTTDSTVRPAPNHPPLDRSTGRANAAASNATNNTRNSSKPRSSTRACRFIRAAAARKYRSEGNSTGACFRRRRKCSHTGTASAAAVARRSGERKDTWEPKRRRRGKDCRRIRRNPGRTGSARRKWNGEAAKSAKSTR
jgi:hypothetical protein